MIICLGPVCVPVWPLLFLALKPLWNMMPESWQNKLADFWFDIVYPTIIAPWFEKLPEKVQKLMMFGIPKGARRAKAKAGAEGEKGDAKKAVTPAAKPAPAGGKDRFTNQSELTPIESEDHFDEAVAASCNYTVVMDFTAEWCKPCQKLKPVLSDLAKEHADRGFRCFLVDIEEQEDIAEKHDVVALPTVLVFKDGKVSAEHRMGVNEEKLKDIFEGSKKSR